MFDMNDYSIENGILMKYTGNEDCVFIPECVTGIDMFAFFGLNYRFSSFAVDEKNTAYSSFDGILYNKEHTEIALVPPAIEGQITIPSGVTRIPDYQFKGRELLTSVTFPEGLTVIGFHSFVACKGLQTITIPKSLTRISGAFDGCDQLSTIYYTGDIESLLSAGMAFWNGGLPLKYASAIYCNGTEIHDLIIPDNVEKVEKYAFNSYRGLTSIYIPASVNSIGDLAFKQCSNLKTITVDEKNSNYSSFDGILYNKQQTEIILAPPATNGEKVLPSGVTSIPYNCFMGCDNLTGITIPESITSIGDNAFYGCKKLSQVRFLAFPEKVGKNAFQDCDGQLCMYFPSGAFATAKKIPVELLIDSLDINDEEYAYLSLFQNTKRCREFLRNRKPSKPDGVFGYMLDLYKSVKKVSVEDMVSFMRENASQIDPSRINEALTLLRKNKYKGINEIEAAPEIADRLSGKISESNPSEEYIQELIKKPGKEILPNAMKYAKKGIPYAEGGRLCSVDIIAFIISESIREWDRIKRVYGEYATEFLQDGSKINYSAEAKRLGNELDKKALSDLLEDAVAKPTYRPCLIAWAYFATDESIQRITANYKSMLLGSSKDKIKAGNIREALLINDSHAAMHFFSQISDLERYAYLHEISASNLHDAGLLPSFSFDNDGIKRYDIGDTIIEVSISPTFGFKIFDTSANKEIRSFPKKSIDPDKAKACAEDFETFRKEVISFAKRRTETIHKMHISGKYISQELWYKDYINHPIIKHLAQMVVWQDESQSTFIADNGKIVTDEGAEYIPQGKIRIAHVLDLKSSDISSWQTAFAKSGKKQLFEQIWEPVMSWAEEEVKDRYDGIEMSEDERNTLKKSLKLRGVEVRAKYMDREYDFWEGKYEFSNVGTMEYGDCLSIEYTVDPFRKITTFGKATVHTKPGNREMNAVLLELDRAVVSSWIIKDNDTALSDEALSVFSASQITSLLNLAIEKKASKSTALLLDFKNEHFPEFADINEFSLDW